MKSFPTFVTWEGGKQHENFVSLPNPVLRCNQFKVGVESYSMSRMPDEPIYLGYMKFNNPFDWASQLTMKIELSQSSVYTAGNYLENILSFGKIMDFVVNAEMERKKKLDVSIEDCSFETVQKEFWSLEKSVPYIEQAVEMTKLVVPKNTYCELYFNNMIDIKHFPMDKVKEYLFYNSQHWFKFITTPVLGLKIQLNDSAGESKIVKYITDGDNQESNFLTFTSFETKNINKISVQVVDSIGNVLQTIGNCFLWIKSQ